MTIKTEQELELLKKAGRVVSETIQLMIKSVEDGMTTAELDLIGRKNMERHGARSAPELAYGFPGATCISVNEEVAHGLPGTRVLKKGDLINIDVSCELNGYYADTGASFQFGEADPKLAL